MMIVGLVGVFALGALVLAGGAVQPTSRRAIAARITALGRLQRCAEPAWSLRLKRKRSGAKAPQLSSMCCPISRLRPIFLPGRCGGVNNDSTSREAPGSRIQDTASFHRQRTVI